MPDPTETTDPAVSLDPMLLERLAGVVRADAIPGWLETPNPAFDGLTPLEVVQRGEAGRLWQMLDQLESGVAS